MLEIAGKQDQRDRQRDRHRHHRILQREQDLPQAVDAENEKIPEQHAQEIQSQDSSDLTEELDLPAQFHHESRHQEIECQRNNKNQYFHSVHVISRKTTR